MGEAGFPDFVVDTFSGILAPRGAPKDVIATLNAALVQALQSPDVRQRFAAMLIEPRPGPPESFATFLREQMATWVRVVKDSGLKVD